MDKRDRSVLVFFVVLSLAFATAAVASYLRHDSSGETSIAGVSPSDVIGDAPQFEGNVSSPYTLVEFGDYQCPPCRLAYRRLSALLTKPKPTFRFVFRNMPLVDLHPFAMQAAVTAEAAREQGAFWKVHDALYQTPLDSQSILGIAHRYCPNQVEFAKSCLTTAPVAVERDVDLSKRIKISSTPTFILCCPDGRVIRLSSLDEIGDIAH